MGMWRPGWESGYHFGQPLAREPSQYSSGGGGGDLMGASASV
jgi:hypothetical protein